MGPLEGWLFLGSWPSWAISVTLMHKWAEKKRLVGPPFLAVKISSGRQFQAVNVGACGLSHKHVENNYRCNCVKFGGCKPNIGRDMANLIIIHAQAKSDP